MAGRGAVTRQTGIRDTMDGERLVQTFLAAHFALQRLPVQHVDIALVFRGRELAFCESVEAA